MYNRVAAEFKRLLGVSLEIIDYQGKNAFSYMLNVFYDFYLCKGNDTRFILMCVKDRAALTPGRVAKHIAQIQSVSGLPAIFAAESLVPYKRQRFIEKHIPFIIPGKQAYIPFSGIFLTDGGPKLDKHFDELGNLAQILILARLIQKFTKPLSITDAIAMFSYSRISVIRAFDELEFFQLGQRNSQNKYLEFPLTGKDLWKKAFPYLKNPCKKRIGLEYVPDELLTFPAGITALSERSMLSEDSQVCLATEAKEFNKLKLSNQCPIDDAPIILELWKYPPNIISNNSIDPCSLYLTLMNETDDRVQIALDKIMKGIHL